MTEKLKRKNTHETGLVKMLMSLPFHQKLKKIITCHCDTLSIIDLTHVTSAIKKTMTTFKLLRQQQIHQISLHELRNQNK